MPLGPLGAVGGHFALRYVLALVAIVLAHVLAKRLWGRWAGVVAVVVVMSSRVVVTASQAMRGPRRRARADRRAVPEPPAHPPHGVRSADRLLPGARGSAARLVDQYRLEHEVRRWVPNATYRSEQLLTCRTSGHDALELQLIGLFHAEDNLLPGLCSRVPRAARRTVAGRHAAQLVVIAVRPMRIGPLLARLAPLHPVVARHGVLRAGPLECRLWLVEIPAYLSAHVK